MDSESIIPSLSNGIVGSRFVSQDEIDTAKARRDEQWKAAYARLGQEPPPQQQEDSYDGRSLAEIAKQEEWEEKTKLANQFRALEEDEIMFLDSIREKQEDEERQRREKDGEEVKNFKEAVAARTTAINATPPFVTQSLTSASASKPLLPVKRDLKKTLKGVIVKRKPKVSAVTERLSTESTVITQKKIKGSIPQVKVQDNELPNPKRQKISES